MNNEFDVVVVGSGSAGTTVGMAARKEGRSVAIIDDRPFGGTCALRGCDPKKVLVAAAGVIDAAQRLAAYDIIDRVPKLDWPNLMRFKRTFTDPVPDQRLRAYQSVGITPIRGRARFSGPQTI